MIELRGLSKRFGAKQVLDGLDSGIERGETMVVIGAGGHGLPRHDEDRGHLLGQNDPGHGQAGQQDDGRATRRCVPESKEHDAAWGYHRFTSKVAGTGGRWPSMVKTGGSIPSSGGGCKGRHVRGSVSQTGMRP